MDFGTVPYGANFEIGWSCVDIETTIEHDGLDGTLLAEQRGANHAARGRVTE